MSDLNSRELFNDFRARGKGGGEELCQVPLEADRRHFLKMSDNMRLMQSEIGDHRQLKLLWHVRRMAIGPEWPTVAGFKENDGADDVGVSEIEDINPLLHRHKCFLRGA